VRSATSAQTMLGQMVNVVACPRCRGEGRSWRCPARTAAATAGANGTKRLPRSAAGPASTTATRSAFQRGEVGPARRPAGSLYVAIHVTPHPSLKREGTELFHQLSALPIAQADAGTSVRVPTADAEEDLEIKPGPSRGRRSGLRGRGAPHLPPGGRARRPPRPGRRKDSHELTKEQRDALEAFAAASGESGLGTGKARRARPSQGRAGVTGAAAAEPATEGLIGDATWLELAVTCETEAVEAVSEILSRVAPGGVSVEPG